LNDLHAALSRQAAEAIVEQLKEKPGSCLALPTGRSPVDCYELLANWSQQKRIDWSKAKCFALDDYLDVDESISFQTFLEMHLYRHTNLPANHRYNPRFTDNYDQLVEQCGGLDLTILGLGNNGHIAFNEPLTPQLSFTHCIWLTTSTRVANQYYFEEAPVVPLRGITMGIATILASRKIILLASGEHKRDILEKAISGKIDINLPASLLTIHPNLTILTDFEFRQHNMHRTSA
jgi:glucosamine-6-phosphate deaminase